MKYYEDTCIGQYSIQNEINRLAKESGKDWAKRIKSDQWREAVRQKLQATPAEWCDYKSGTCNCDDSLSSS